MLGLAVASSQGEDQVQHGTSLNLQNRLSNGKMIQF